MSAVTGMSMGSQCSCRHGQATERSDGRKSDECFMKHVSLQAQSNKTFCCEDRDNAALPRMVAGHEDTFACA
jgi:hypothetical protein